MTDERIRLTLASNAELRIRIGNLKIVIGGMERALRHAASLLRNRERDLEAQALRLRRRGARIEELMKENARLRKLVRSLNGEEPTP